MKYLTIIMVMALMAFSNVLCQDTSYVNIGDEFTATVTMELSGEVSAVGFDILFENTALQYISNEKKGVFDLEIVNTVGSNKLAVALAKTGTGQYVKDCTVDLVSFRFKLLKEYAEIAFANGEILKDDTNPGYENQWNKGIVKVQTIPVEGKVIMRVKISKE